MIGGLETLGHCELWATANISGGASVALIHLEVKHFARREEGGFFVKNLTMESSKWWCGYRIATSPHGNCRTNR